MAGFPPARIRHAPSPPPCFHDLVRQIVPPPASRRRNPAPRFSSLTYSIKVIYFIVLYDPCTAIRPFSGRFDPFCRKSTEVPFHEQFTLNTDLFQSCLIKPNQVIFLSHNAHQTITPLLYRNSRNFASSGPKPPQILTCYSPFASSVFFRGKSTIRNPQSAITSPRPPGPFQNAAAALRGRPPSPRFFGSRPLPASAANRFPKNRASGRHTTREPARSHAATNPES